MERLLILLLLAGCDAGAEREAAAPPSGASPAGRESSSKASPAEQAAQIQQRAERALAAILADPAGARYSDLRAGAAGALCGRVEDRQAGGRSDGSRPFVVTPEGVAVLSATAEVMFTDPEDLFPDFYIRWCASPDELRRIGPRIAAAPLPETVPAEVLTGPTEGAPLPPAAAEVAKAAPPAAPPPVEEDSFSRAVLRNGSDGTAR